MRRGGEIGLLFLDLDRFKAVNDTYGHEVGDRVLVETGQRLRGAMRDVDTVCRLGGDEFVVLCAPIDGPQGLEDLVARLTAMPPVTVLVGGRVVEVASSVGAVMVEQDDDLDLALRRADAAMYRAKRRTRVRTGDGERVEPGAPPWQPVGASGSVTPVT